MLIRERQQGRRRLACCRQELVKMGGQFGAEGGAAKTGSLGLTGRRVISGGVKGCQHCRQTLRSLLGKMLAADARHNSVKRTTGAKGHNRPPYTHRLHRRNAKILQTREEKSF